MRARLRHILFGDAPAGTVAAVLGVAVLLVAVTFIPYALFSARTPPDHQFMGIIDSPSDQNCYLAWMRQAAQGRALWREHMTSEPHEPVFTNSLWYVLGRTVAITGWDPYTVYEGARVLFGFVHFVVLYRVLALFLKDQRQRWYAFLLVAVGAGFGGYLAPFIGDRRPDLFVDAYVTEAFSFYSVLAYPHFALSLTFLYVTLALAMRALESASVPLAVIAGVVGLLMASFHPYCVATVGVVCAVYAALMAHLGRIRAGRGVALLVGLGLPMLPQVAYLLWAVSTSPIMASWSRAMAESCRSYAPLGYLMGYGLVGLLALTGIRLVFAWEAMQPRELFIAAWLLGGVPLLYSFPVLGFERRLSEGLQLPITVLAVRQLFGPVAEALARTPTGRTWGVERTRRALPVVVLVLSLPTAAWLLVRPLAVTRDPSRIEDKYYLHREELGALRYLTEVSTEEDVVLSAGGIGNYIPRMTDARVLLGHYAETVDRELRERDVAGFFSVGAADAARTKLLRERGVTYVWWGIEEQQLGAFDPTRLGYLVPVFASEHVAVFRVDRFRMPSGKRGLSR